jgi:glycosyltransferase involved in cell wall biosynthesis
MAVSFVIPVRNDARRLARCLASIERNGYPPDRVECIVVDNGSTDGSAEVARSRGARVLSLPDLRVAALRNRAAASAGGDVLAFVDADHEISPDWIATAVGIFRDERVGAAGALYSAPSSGTTTQRMYGELRGHTVGQHETPWLASGNFAVRRGLFQQVGGFDESLETCEDVDLCQRLHRSGFRLIADERLESIHTGDPATLRELFLAERWRGRNNLRVSARSIQSWRDIPSVVIPVIDLLVLALVAIALLITPVSGATAIAWALGGAAVFTGLAALRMVRMARFGGLRTMGDVASAYAVALTYDAARALALVWPAGHRRRIGSSPVARDRTA